MSTVPLLLLFYQRYYENNNNYQYRTKKRERHAVGSLRLDHVGYAYGRHLALNDVTHSFGVGLYGLLGPNGAGKTTLLRIMATALAPRSGRVFIGGLDTSKRQERRKVRDTLGFLPQHFELMEASTALHNVQYATWLHGGSWQHAGEQARRTLETVGMGERETSLVRTLSGGMRQRIGIACAMACQPEILLLDEPTVGLDPEQRLELRAVLSEYARYHTVILSTHMVEDVVAMADEILILAHGSFVFDGNADELAAHADERDSLTTSWEAGYRSIMSDSTGKS
ncbi:ATP-binding cassette domain-containing protein [Bifidobacterium cuniculi]|nr:ATP-binding cassette domain-containing protein [Bifidobacterium cuniculi]